MERNFTMGFSKYQNKIRKTLEETESGRIALAIYDAQIRHQPNRQFRTPDGIKIESSEDGLVLYIWKSVEYKANRSWVKIIPNFEYSVEQIAKVLDAQPWEYL